MRYIDGYEVGYRDLVFRVGHLDYADVFVIYELQALDTSDVV